MLWLIIGLFILASIILWWYKAVTKNTKKSKPISSNRPRVDEDDENVMRIGNRVIRNRHTAVNTHRRRQVEPEAEVQQPSTSIERPIEELNSDSEEDEQDGDNLHEPVAAREITIPGKIGKKKQLKLEMKAEKRAMRERELVEREERRKKQEEEEEVLRQKEQEREQREKEKEEAERKAKEEKERQEYEEYLKLKQSFLIEEQGYEANVDENSMANNLLEFINTIKERKIVLLEELAAEFKLKTQEVIDRITNLLETEQISGVLDDRGKFIYITEDEYNSVAKFIKQRGRVSIIELVENSNNLIKL